MVALINSYRYPTGSAVDTPTLDTATAWWTPADVSGGQMVEQRGTGLHLTLGATTSVESTDPTITDDGTHHVAQFRRADVQRAFHDDHASLDLGADPWTIAAVIKPITIDGTQQILVAKRANVSAVGLMCYIRTTNRFAMASPAGIVESAGLAVAGTTYRVGWRKLSNGNANIVVNGTGGSAYAPGDLSNTDPFMVGTRTDLATPGDFDLYGLALWNTVGQGVTEIEAACNELLAVAAL